MLFTPGTIFYIGTLLSLSTKVLACPEYDSLHNETRIVPRYFSIRDVGQFTNPWPKSTIPYCFATPLAQKNLAELVRKGWVIWQDAGVSSRIDMHQAKDCSSRNDVLMISINGNGLMRTSIGYASTSDGPSMTFDPSNQIGMLDPVANMAHEIGHAWGFYYEQQRPDAWDNTVADGNGVPKINFHCQNLANYAAVLANAGPARMGRACKSCAVAKAEGFEAMEFLPFNTNDSEYAEDFDWDSIMLYGSQIGGAGFGAGVGHLHALVVPCLLPASGM